MARNPLSELARIAGRIDQLNAEANRIARRLERATRPETVERLSMEGASIEKRIREAEKRFQKAERPLLRGPRSRQRKPTIAMEPAIIGTVFTIRGTYGKRNHKLNLEIRLTWRGLVKPKKDEVRQAVRDLANRRHPEGFDVDVIRYGRKAERNRVRSEGDLEQIAAAVNAMPLIVTGENE